MSLFSFLKPKPKVPRQTLSSSALEARLRMHLHEPWGERTKVIATDRAYLTTTREEVERIAKQAWLPWRETAVGGGSCEIQCFKLIVTAFEEAMKLRLPGRLAIYAALTEGDKAHAYIVAELSATQVVIYDQTSGQFIDADEMDAPIRYIQA